MTKNVLIIGSGVRETYIAKRLIVDSDAKINLTIISNKKNPQLFEFSENYFIIENFNLSSFLNHENIETFVNQNQNNIEFVVIGPEAALEAGYADFFESIGISTIGPQLELAKIETSKMFCREFLRKSSLSELSPLWCNISGLSKPEVRKIFLNLSNKYGNLVVKKIGLCGGKGVKVQGVDFSEYIEIEQFIFNEGEESGNIILEQRLIGKEFSLMTLTSPNGNLYHFPPVKDYKRRFNGNQGPNTGSMGSVICANNTLQFLSRKDLELAEIYNEKILNNLKDYRGVFYGSYIKTTEGSLKLIEANCRFGDPECVLALCLLKTDLYKLFLSLTNKWDGRRVEIDFSRDACMGLYMVPPEYALEDKQSTNTLRNALSISDRDSNIIMGDVKSNGDSLFTGSSRTLFVFSKEPELCDCINNVHNIIKGVNGHLDYRTDIGAEFIEDAYENCGVSVSRAQEALNLIKPDIVSTYNSNVTSEYGSFSGEYKLGDEILLASIDGVGTKTKFVTDFLDEEGYLTLGMDLINHSINDILVQGGRPLFFLDYFGTGKLDPSKLRYFVSGIANECKKYNVVLIGGETAEMPGFYSSDEANELVGCIVGVKDKRFTDLNKNLERGDVLVYLESSGPHTNGYSFIRNLDLDEETVKAVPELLEPHRCYYNDVNYFLETYGNDFIKGMCHITGGGLFENLKRIIPEDLFKTMELNINEIELPIWAQFILDCSMITKKQLFDIFNCGVGYVLIVSPENYARIIEDENNDLIYLGKL